MENTEGYRLNVLAGKLMQYYWWGHALIMNGK